MRWIYFQKIKEKGAIFLFLSIQFMNFCKKGCHFLGLTHSFRAAVIVAKKFQNCRL